MQMRTSARFWILPRYPAPVRLRIEQANHWRDGYENMQIINRLRLKEFWEDHTRSEHSLRAWFQLVSGYNWESLEALQATFPSAVGHGDLVAFDLHGSSYYVVASIDYSASTVWVREVLVYPDFGTDQWKSLAGAEDEPGRSYRELVEAFALRPIHDDDHLRQAYARIESLLTRIERSRDEQDYLDVLSLLVEDYEHCHVSIPSVSAAEIVRLLISEHRMSQAEIIPLLGSKQKAMAILQATRPLDLRQATRSARYFKLPIESFMDPDDLEIELPKAPRKRR